MVSKIFGSQSRSLLLSDEHLILISVFSFNISKKNRLQCTHFLLDNVSQLEMHILLLRFDLFSRSKYLLASPTLNDKLKKKLEF